MKNANNPTSMPFVKRAIIILYPQFSKQLIKNGHEGNVSAKKSSRIPKPSNATITIYAMQIIKEYLRDFLYIQLLQNKQ